MTAKELSKIAKKAIACQKAVKWASHEYVRFLLNHALTAAKQGHGSLYFKLVSPTYKDSSVKGTSYECNFVLTLLKQKGYNVQFLSCKYDISLYKITWAENLTFSNYIVSPDFTTEF